MLRLVVLTSLFVEHLAHPSGAVHDGGVPLVVLDLTDEHAVLDVARRQTDVVCRTNRDEDNADKSPLNSVTPDEQIKHETTARDARRLSAGSCDERGLGQSATQMMS